MPNRRKHQKYGAAAGGIGLAILDFITQKQEMSGNPEQKFDFGRLLGKTAMGAAGGLVLSTAADVLEPGTHSHHRDFFHSFTALGLVGFGTYKLHKSDLPKEIKEIGTAAALGYASHIVADSGTPRSIPLISKRII